jgi:hypothetical protein
MDIIQGFDPCVSGSSPDEIAKYFALLKITNIKIIFVIWHFIELLH